MRTGNRYSAEARFVFFSACEGWFRLIRGKKLVTAGRGGVLATCWVKYTQIHDIASMVMAHKTLTISEEAYAALARLKERRESFTDVILRLTAKARRGTLLDYVRSMQPDEEFAENLEQVVQNRERSRVRTVQF